MFGCKVPRALGEVYCDKLWSDTSESCFDVSEVMHGEPALPRFWVPQLERHATALGILYALSDVPCPLALQSRCASMQTLTLYMCQALTNWFHATLHSFQTESPAVLQNPLQYSR